jgi:glycine/D-amino acid oxidase-like deaminating enzyme
MNNKNNFVKYNPKYDPLVDSNPGRGQHHAPTFWLADAGDLPEDDGAITQDIDVDVAIIGSGYTGLSTAIHLAKDHGIKATVLEANGVSFGCSTRNGGQAQCASGRLKRSQWIKAYGKETALNLHAEIMDAMGTFKELIKDIDCDAEPGGHLFIAHKPQVIDSIKQEIEIHNRVFNYKSTFIDKDTLREHYVNDQESYGAMLEPEGMSIQPAKLAFGYLNMARDLGAKVHTSSPVIEWRTINNIHYLRTPGGVVKANKVVVATGGYTSQSLHKSLKNKIMPVLSNNMVTRVLTNEELTATGIKTGISLTDARTLRHYYRLLPSNRLQIGSRSAITGKGAPNKKYQEMLVADIAKKFPVLKDIKIDYSWWGWVDVSHDMMPRVSETDTSEGIFYALGYGGNGVMYSAQAGRRVAALVAGKMLASDLPIFNSQLPYPKLFNCIESKFFSPYRRLGQSFLYKWYSFNDERGKR